MNYISVEQFKTENPRADLSGFSDATVSGMITKASRKVDEFCETSFGLTTQTDEIVEGSIDADASIVFFPRKIPIKTITSLAVVKGPTTIDINLVDGNGNANYTIPDTGDRVVIPLSYLAYNSTTIFQVGVLRVLDWFFKATYTAGEEDIPETVKDATSLYVLDMLARSTNLAGATRVQQGGISISYGQKSGKSDFVKDAESMLGHYRRVSGF